MEVDRTEREGRREESDAWCFVTSAERCRATRIKRSSVTVYFVWEVLLEGNQAICLSESI